MYCCIVFSSCRRHAHEKQGQELQDKTSSMMYVRCMNRACFSSVLVVLFLLPLNMRGEANRDVAMVHPDHGAPFHEQLSGHWTLNPEDDGARHIRFYEDGRFAFMNDGQWTAGSFFILRSDEKSKGVLRLEYYLDGNLHFQEVRCEIQFVSHGDHGEEEHHHEADGGLHHEGEEHAHHHDHDHAEESEHTHEMLIVESLPAAERALNVDGEYGHVH